MYVYCTDFARILLIPVAQPTPPVHFVNLSWRAKHTHVCKACLHILQHLVSGTSIQSLHQPLRCAKSFHPTRPNESMVRTTLVRTPIIHSATLLDDG